MSHRGGIIAQKIDHFGLNPHYRRSIEKTWKTVISCIEQGINYTVRNVTGKDGIPHLDNYSSKKNMLENSMQNHLGFCYTTLLIDFHRQTQGDN